MTTGADRRLRIPRQARSRTVEGSKATAETRDAPAPAADLGKLLLDAKFSVPPPRPGSVGRGDLIDTCRSSTCRLVAVTAPAGYGKSTFLAQWAAVEDRPVAWASLDAFDDDPATLLASLASAFCRAGLGSTDLVVGMRGQGVSVLGRAAPRLAAELRASPVPYVIMLDDVHEQQSPACRDVLGMVVSAIPEGCQLATAGRDEQPELPRLRATADALEIGARDLALDAAGARQVFASAAVSVTPAEAAAVTERTEGWPVGLYLAALIAKQDPDLAQAVSGEDRYVADYLYREVLTRQPKMIQRFLRRSAVLDQLSGPLCEAALRTPGADIQLRRIEAHNLFLTPLDRERRWYRYHALFREFLLGELNRTEPRIVATLHERAADWYESNGLPERAIEHLLQTADRDRATRLVTRMALPTYMTGQLSTVQRWYREIGDANIERYPPLAVLRGWEKALTGDVAEAPRWAAVVDAASFDGAPADGSASFDSARAMLRAGMCAAGPEAMMADAAFAVAQEPACSPYRDTAMWLLAQAHLLAGQLGEARAAFAEASAAAVEMGNFDTVPSAEAQLAWLAMDRGSWLEAAGHVELALATIEDNRMHDYVCSIPAFAAAARLSLHLGDQKEADRQLARAMRSRPVATYLIPYLAVRARLQLARVYVAIADTATARQLLREIDDIMVHRPDLGALGDDAEEFRRTLDAIAAPGGTSPLPLTPAELRLLPYLQTHLTADMISKRLFISIHTVKTEIKAIYRKLGVSSRDDAVQKAKEIGLLGDLPHLTGLAKGS
jgi:LuxR family transcriptional regulator, maltose regulon positive regulatory protein